MSHASAAAPVCRVRGNAYAAHPQVSPDASSRSTPANPISYAYTTACTRSRSPSLPRMRVTWVRTVASDSTKCSAISALDSPRAIWPSTCRSRGVNPSATSGAGVAGLRAKRSSRRRVVVGATTALPAYTVCTASTRCRGPASLSRNPEAPARIAARAYSSRSNVVRIRTRGRSSPRSAARARMRPVASMPAIPGMRTSITTTSTSARRT